GQGLQTLPPLLHHYARAVARRRDGEGLDATTRAFIEISGAAALSTTAGAPAENPLGELERLIALGQAAADDKAAIDAVAEHVRSRLRAAGVMVLGPDP